MDHSGRGWLLAAACRARDHVRHQVVGRTPPNWGPYDGIALARDLNGAITRVIRHQRQQAQAGGGLTMTPESRLLTEVSSNPHVQAMQVAGQRLMETVDLFVKETYREEPFTRDERSLLLGLIQHAIYRLEPLSDFLIYKVHDEQDEKGASS